MKRFGNSIQPLHQDFHQLRSIDGSIGSHRAITIALDHIHILQKPQGVGMGVSVWEVREGSLSWHCTPEKSWNSYGKNEEKMDNPTHSRERKEVASGTSGGTEGSAFLWEQK